MSINEIIPHLYVSNWEASDDPKILKKYNIKAIITLETRPKSNSILNYYQTNNIDHMYIYLPDDPKADISYHFDETYDFIKNHILKGENVLVHCWAGVSRSATIALNYMIRSSYEAGKVYTCPCNFLEAVLNYAREKRNIINPNKGFMKQLLLSAIQYQHNMKEDYNNAYKNTISNVY